MWFGRAGGMEVNSVKGNVTVRLQRQRSGELLVGKKREQRKIKAFYWLPELKPSPILASNLLLPW